MQIRRQDLLFVLAAICVQTACDTGRNRGAPAQELPTWKVATTPRLTLGEESPDSGALFGWIIAARFYPADQHLLLADHRKFQVMTFDVRTKKLVHSVGAEGRGPREFVEMNGAGFFGDTVRVVDRSAKRLSSWARGDQTPKIRPFNSAKSQFGWSDPQIPLAHGNVLFQSYGGRKVTGQFLDSMELIIADVNGTERVAGLFEWFESFHVVDEVGRSMIHRAPLTWLSAVVPAQDGGFWVAEAIAGNLYRISADGSRRVRVPLPVVRESVTEQDRKDYTDSWLNLFPDEKMRAYESALLRKMTFPTELPALSSLAPTADGGVWVAAWARPNASTRTWYVISSAGTVRARIDLPRELEVLDGGEDYLVASGKNAADEVVVMLFDVTH